MHRAEATHVQARPRAPQPAAQQRTLRLPRTTNHAPTSTSLSHVPSSASSVLLINDLVDGIRAASAAMTLLGQIHRATPPLQPTPVGMPHRAAWTAPRPTPLLSCHSFEAARQQATTARGCHGVAREAAMVGSWLATDTVSGWHTRRRQAPETPSTVRARTAEAPPPPSTNHSSHCRSPTLMT